MIKKDIFKLRAPYQPAGDQPQAIDKLVDGLKNGNKHQTLLGVTGSGKTFTMANVIEKVQMPTLVIAHNKTLAAQLTQEYRNFFPNNAVEYFVSYYDYYQPEAYLPNTDTYIEKEAQINDEIDRLRHAATQALLTRKDVIIVSSVSCIYNIGSPESYAKSQISLTVGDLISRSDLINRLIDLQFNRNQSTLIRGTFRVIGANFEIMPTGEEIIYKVEIIADKIQDITFIDPITRQEKSNLETINIFPARHYVANDAVFKVALDQIRTELDARVKYLTKLGKILEADRIKRRTNYDLEMIQEVGYCNGIENYSRYFDGREEGEQPNSLLEFFPKNFLTIIDESHVTIPQIGGMYAGDKSRKQSLIDYGFRLPSALDNRPLMFNEFTKLTGQTIFTTATPGPYELNISDQIVEQIVRPTGLVDPQIEIVPIKNQLVDAVQRINQRIAQHERVLITTLTKKMAEDLSEYMVENKYKVHYLHSGVDTLERIETLTKLRKGEYDIVVGVNLLREGLDLPEVSLILILDADKEGFLRSETSLIQTIGRAARNINGQVILYGDRITGSMERAIKETNRRRNKQLQYNLDHNITPVTINKKIQDITQELNLVSHARKVKDIMKTENLGDLGDITKLIVSKNKEMKQAAKDLEFELAAIIRDELIELKKLERHRNKTLRIRHSS